MKILLRSMFNFTVKSQQSVPLSTPNVITPNQHLTSSRMAADLQAQEILV